MKNQLVFFCLTLLFLSACKKNFLDPKPNSNIVNPITLIEYQELLDNFRALNSTGALPQMSCDEYFIIDKSNFDALDQSTYKGAYLWSKNLYGGETNIQDWNQCYNAVFYANSVLDGIQKIDQTPINQTDFNNVKGQALFFRAYAFFDLVRNFSPIYNQATATTDLGIPIRTSAGIDVIVQRSNLEQSFDQIIVDLNNAVILLRDNFSALNRNRPSKSAAYAMLARVYLYMGKFTDAQKAADLCLSKYSKLIDYNKVDTSSAIPFSYSPDETIFFSSQQYTYTYTTGYGTIWTNMGVDPELIKLYSPNDLRLYIFFEKNDLGNYNVKSGYVGSGFYPFTGLATDEVMLIKAECAARANDPQTAIDVLNKLLINRYKSSSFEPIIPSTSINALNAVLLERRKELVWRALRWSDLKRLNKDGANITLKRNLDGTIYVLPPNSPLYVFPIPDDEIALSGIKQNIR